MLSNIRRWVKPEPAAAFVLWMTAVASAVAASGPPDLGLVLNVDGDLAYAENTLSESEAALRARVDRYADAGIDTLVYSVASGSEIMLYPTRVADIWGWRSTPYDDNPKWSARIQRNRANQQAGGDAIRTAGERAGERGMRFVPSLRMNDAHYAFGSPPKDYPLTGSFYLNHPDKVLGESPIVSKPQYAQLLDFSHPEVRQHRLDQIIEATERYQDIMDGFELDFTRFQLFFPPGTAVERAPLVTDLVHQTRRQLDRLGEQNGKRYLLIGRVPPTPESCAWSGLEIQRWAEEGLIDMVAPSLMMTMGFQMPTDRFKQLFKGRPVAVYPTMLPRVGWRWPVRFDEDAAASEEPTRRLSMPQLRAAALNHLSLGADGLYLFNFRSFLVPQELPDGSNAPPVRELKHPGDMARRDLVFTVTKAYWQDHEGTYEHRKQLPAQLPVVGEPLAVTLLVGADPADWSDDVELRLRIGLRGVDPDPVLAVDLNKHNVFRGNATDALVLKSNTGKQADLAHAMLEIPIAAGALKRGSNVVELAILESEPLTVTDVELVVDQP